MSQNTLIRWLLVCLILLMIVIGFTNYRYRNIIEIDKQTQIKIDSLKMVNEEFTIQLFELQTKLENDSNTLNQIKNVYITNVQNFYSNDSISNDSLNKFIAIHIERKREELYLLYGRRK